MTRLLLIAMALLSTSAFASSTLRSVTRVILLTEETPAPGTGSSFADYPPCYMHDSTSFQLAILSASNECAIKTSYNWQSDYLPTATERRELCECKDLIDVLQQISVPRCSLIRDRTEFSYKNVIEFAFGLCSMSNDSTTGSKSSSAVSADTSSPPAVVDTNVKSPAKSNPHVGLIVGVVAGVLAIVIAAFVAYKCGQRRRNRAKSGGNAYVQSDDVVGAMPLSPLEEQPTSSRAVYTGVVASPVPSPSKRIATFPTTERTTGSTTYSNSIEQVRPTEQGMWNDPIILAIRIPHDSIFFGPLLSRGGYGEVFKGTYKGATVAIKQLLPERRKDLTQIDAFLSEIKLMSVLEHERIVRFIGVAWNSLSDACAVVEYMENGDLRSVLTRWGRGEEMRPQGFDADKVKIALHIAHALTYLHSLQPVVVHRDLKSKNILLNANYDAKLTDFGVSRERADSTMTAGVGSSLWMAPEVMLGERYDEKADVFSFGVVLSELDSHQLPYSHAKEAGTEYALSDTALLQLVSMGRLTVSFTEHANANLVSLGRECVHLDPRLRPTAAGVLHRVHQALRNSF